MGAANEKTEWSKGQSGDRMGDIVGFDPHCGWLRNPASPKGWLKHVETLYINSGIQYNDNIYIYIYIYIYHILSCIHVGSEFERRSSEQKGISSG